MHRPAPATLWTPPTETERPELEHEDWLDAELARGLADLEAGRSTSLQELRSEFDLPNFSYGQVFSANARTGIQRDLNV